MSFNIANAPLKGIFFVHFTLTVWALQGDFLYISYMFYNLIFFGVLLWGIHSKDSEEPVQMAIFINVVSIVLDIICLATHGPHATASGDDLSKWSLAMAIINLIARPVSTIFLYRIQTERLGGYNNYGVPGISDYFGRQGPYENIDQSVPQTTVDTGSPYHTGYDVEKANSTP